MLIHVKPLRQAVQTHREHTEHLGHSALQCHQTVSRHLGEGVEGLWGHPGYTLGCSRVWRERGRQRVFLPLQEKCRADGSQPGAIMEASWEKGKPRTPQQRGQGSGGGGVGMWGDSGPEKRGAYLRSHGE